MSRSCRFLLLSALFASGLPARELAWRELQLGHSPQQTVALIGEPLLRSKGRGFEKWTYDDGAEVLFHGTLVGWTVPAALRLPARSEDVWRKWPGIGYDAALRRVAPVEAPKPAGSAPRKAPVPAVGVGFEDYLRG